MTQKLKIAFAGTPEFAAAALRAIIAAGFDVPLVLTQPDRPAGRGMTAQTSAVKQVALTHNIAIDQPEKLRTPEQQARLAACGADVLVVAAYGLILPQAVLDMPALGCLNIHASLLPRWRGAAPIHRAIEASDSETGITLMQMDAGLDTGAMLMRQALPIASDDNTASLHDKLATLGAAMIVDALGRLNELAPTPQPSEGVTYAHKIEKRESAIDFNLPARDIERRLRAFNPFPGASANFGGTIIKIWQAQVVDAKGSAGQIINSDGQGILVACGEQALRIQVLQKPGGKRLPAEDFLRGFAMNIGTFFDVPTAA